MKISIKEYAELCGITVQGIDVRINKGLIIAESGKKMGYSGRLIDTDLFPPEKKQKSGRKTLEMIRKIQSK